MNRNEKIIFRLTPNEKDQLIQYSSNSHMTQSEFIRQAIFDKIRRIDNPYYRNDFSHNFHNLHIKQDERDNIITEIGKKLSDFEKTLYQLRPLAKQAVANKNMIIIDKILRENNGKLKITKLMKESGLGGLLYDVLSLYPEKYEINMYNEVILNE